MNDRDAYIPLPGRVAGPMYSARLYHGPDHLLKSTVQGFHEHFRRFAWEDIQGVVVEETPWNGVVNVALVLVLGLLVISFLTFTDRDWRVAILYLPFLGLISLLMLINLRRGPTCKAWLLTAVSRERLWSVNRVKVAESLVAAVAPLIRERQEAAALAEAESASDPGPGPGPAAPARESAPIETERGRWHAAGVLIIAGFMAMDVANLNLSASHRILDFIEITAFAVSFMVCITALVGQFRHRTPRPLRHLGFALAGYHMAVVMFALGGIAATLVMMVQNPGAVPQMDPRSASWYRPSLYAALVLEGMTVAFGAYTFARLRMRARSTGSDLDP